MKKLTGLYLTLLVLCVMFFPSLTFAADDYPYPNECTDTNGSRCVDPWKFYYRQCTSYVAWRMNRDAGTTEDPYSFYNHMRTPSSIKWTDAGHWADHARDLGIEVNNTPAAGAIAHWGYSEIGGGMAMSPMLKP